MYVHTYQYDQYLDLCEGKLDGGCIGVGVQYCKCTDVFVYCICDKWIVTVCVNFLSLCIKFDLCPSQSNDCLWVKFSVPDWGIKSTREQGCLTACQPM
jgi:hypothetical protein